MTENPSFVLRGVEDVVYEQRTIPESTLGCSPCLVHDGQLIIQ